MITTFGDNRTEDVFDGSNTARTRRFPTDVYKRARNKLFAINAAPDLMCLNSPPGNNLEALSGDLAGFHSIRINDQWRIIFIHTPPDQFSDVRIIDYH